MSRRRERFEVFLAHSKGDKEYVRAIYELLTLDGFDPWFDEVSLIPGQNWPLEIAKAVERAVVIAVFLSKSAISTEGYLHKEIAIAVEAAQRQPEGSIAIVPIRLDDVEPPRSLQHLQWVDVQHTDQPRIGLKIRILIDLDPFRKGFMIGGSYLRLRRALLYRAQQVGRFSFPDRDPTEPLGFYKDEFWPGLYNNYLVHGRSPDGSVYFGTAKIDREQESLKMLTKVGSETLLYTGKPRFSQLQFTGAHDVSYVPSGSGLLIGSWDKGGLEELIPALSQRGRKRGGKLTSRNNISL